MIRTQKNHTQAARKVGQIMGINVNSTRLTEVLARVEGFISDSSELGSRSSKLGSRNVKFYVVTPNPELILMAQKDERLKEALNGTELAIPDGIGLKLEIPDLNIIKGRELFSELVALAARKNWKVFLLGGLDREAELAVKKLKAKNLKLKIEYARGPRLDQNAQPTSKNDRKLEREAVEKINRFAPELLFVAFGNPKQEIWVHNNYSKLNIGGAMAVGGAFRYVAGLSKPLPKWMERVGLEWLWRLLTEPRRLGRIFRAVIVFPVRVFLSKF